MYLFTAPVKSLFDRNWKVRIFHIIRTIRFDVPLTRTIHTHYSTQYTLYIITYFANSVTIKMDIVNLIY